MKQSEFRLAVFCPSRGRPGLAAEMEASFPCPVYFYLNEDDPELFQYSVNNSMIGPDAPIAYSTNLLWKQTDADAYMFCGDDAVNRCDRLEEAVYIASCSHNHGIWAAGVHDGREKGSFPHPIVSRKWAETLGYMVPPIFLHWHIDTYTEKLARRINRFVDLSNTVLVEHRTPKTGKMPADETFRRIRGPEYPRPGVRARRDAYVASFDRYLDADAELLKASL